MVLSLLAGLAVAAHAAPAVPSFETMLLDVRSAVVRTHAGQRAVKDAGLGQRIDRDAWDVQREQRDGQTLRRDLQILKSRLSRYRAPQRGQPDTDPGLRWDVQRVSRGLEQHARELQWTRQDLQAVRQAVTGPDAELNAPATRLEGAVTWFSSDERWLESELTFISFDLQRAGFAFEAFDYQRSARAVSDAKSAIEDETRQLLAKLR
jgi:hypothetical protein